MITCNIRKQGGAAIMTIPSDVLKILNIEIGSVLELKVINDSLVVHPVLKKRKRYSLKELMQGVTPQKIKALNKKTSWAREGQAAGRELT